MGRFPLTNSGEQARARSHLVYDPLPGAPGPGGWVACLGRSVAAVRVCGEAALLIARSLQGYHRTLDVFAAVPELHPVFTEEQRPIRDVPLASIHEVTLRTSG